MINNPYDFHLCWCFFLNLLNLQGFFFLFIFTKLSSPVDQLCNQLFKCAFFQVEPGFSGGFALCSGAG